MTCGEKITQLRKNANLTQGQLGEKLNVSSQAVSKWEHDQAEPDVITIKKLASIFGVSIDELLDYESEKKPTEEKQPVVDVANVADSVSVAVADVIKQAQPVMPIGYCSECGIMVTDENLGQKEPRVLCKKCREKHIAIERKKLAELEERDNNVIRKIKRKKYKSIIVGLLFVAIIMTIYFVIAIKGNDTTNNNVKAFFIFALISYCAYSFVTDFIFMEGPVFKILTRIAIGHGSVFIFFLSLVGMGINVFVSPFSFPFTIIKTNRKIKKKIPITDDDVINYMKI